MRAQDGRHTIEDNSTLCTLRSEREIAILSNTSFQAQQGTILVTNFLFQGANKTQLVLQIDCQGFEAFTLVGVISISLPEVIWVQQRITGISSDTATILYLTPASRVNILADEKPMGVLGAVCFVSLAQSDHSDDKAANARLLGQTTAVPVDGVADFNKLGIDAVPGQKVELLSTCQLRSGTEIRTTLPLVLNISEITVAWKLVPFFWFLPSSTSWPFVVRGFQAEARLSKNLEYLEPIPCSLTIVSESQELPQLFELRREVTFPMVFNGSTTELPDFELVVRSNGGEPPQINFGVFAKAQLECAWVNNRRIHSSPISMKPVTFHIDLQAPDIVYRLDQTEVEVTVVLNETTLQQRIQSGADSAQLWYPAMMCSLSVLVGPSSTLSHPDNNLFLQPWYSHERGGAHDSTLIRIDALGGTHISLGVSCSANGAVFGFSTVNVTVANVSAYWSAFRTVWLPSSGDFQPVMANPSLAVGFLEEGFPVNSTDRMRCIASISYGDFEPGSGVGSETLLVNPPSGGYFGTRESDLVELDRVAIQAPFAALVPLLVECFRNGEAFQLPLIRVNMRQPGLQLVQPASRAILLPGEEITVILHVLPMDELTTNHALVVCSLSASNLSIQGIVSSAGDGIVEFSEVVLGGAAGSHYFVQVECKLGNRVLATRPAFEVKYDHCPSGSQPNQDRTQCLQCRKSEYSDGGGEPCRSCPAVGAVCANGQLSLAPAYYPAETRLLGGTLAMQWYVNADSVFYPCWNAEACVLNTSTRAIACAAGYAGPLCGVCDDGSASGTQYVGTGTECIECWPTALNVTLLSFASLLLLALLTYVAAFQRVKAASPLKIVIRIGVTYVQMLASLGLFRAQATETFRAVVGVTQSVGSSIAAAPPLQCTFRMNFYARFIFDMGLPFFTVPVAAACAACVLLIRACKGTIPDAKQLPQPSTPLGSQPHGSTQFVLGSWNKNPLYSKSHKNGGREMSAAEPSSSKASLSDSVSPSLQSTPTTHPAIQEFGFTGKTRTAASRNRNWRPVFIRLLRDYWKRKEFLAPTVFLMFFFYNSMSATIATMFRCRPEVIDGKQFFATDMSVQCYTPAHVVGMIVTAAAALCFNIGFPLLLLLFLRKHSAHLTRSDIFSKFGFLYQGYSIKRRMYAWEVLVLIRKFAVVLAASSFQDPWYQAISGIAIVVVSLVLQVRFQPYDVKKFNRLEELVLTALVCTQVTTLIYLRSETVSEDHANDAILSDVIVTGILLLINGVTAVVLIVTAIQALRQQRRSAALTRSSRMLKAEGGGPTDSPQQAKQPKVLMLGK